MWKRAAAGAGRAAGATAVDKDAGALADDTAPRLVVRGRLPKDDADPEPRVGRGLLGRPIGYVSAYAAAAGDRLSLILDRRFAPSPTPAGFELVLESPHLRGPGHVEVFLPTQGAVRSGQEGALVLFRDPLAGEVDLGEVALGEHAPILVAGRVLSADGAPAAGADVEVHCVFQGRRRRMVLARFTATSGVDGEFSVQGDVRGADALEVVAAAGSMSTGPVRCAGGDGDLRLRLSAKGSIGGTIDVPQGLPLDALEVVVPGAGAADSAVRGTGGRFTLTRDPERLVFPARSPFEITGLPRGRYDVEVRFRNSAEPLARHAGVEIAAQTTQLPPLRVTRPVRRVSIEVLGPLGSAMPGARAWLRTKGDAGGFREVTLDAAGTASCAWVGQKLEVAAHAPEMCYAFDITAGNEITLVLEPSVGTPVRIDLPPGGPPLGDGAEIAIVLAWRAPPDAPPPGQGRLSGDDPREAAQFKVPWPASGPATATLDEPGWYAVGVSVRHGQTTTTTFAEPSLVDGSGEAVRRTLGLTADDVRRLVR